MDEINVEPISFDEIEKENSISFLNTCRDVLSISPCKNIIKQPAPLHVVKAWEFLLEHAAIICSESKAGVYVDTINASVGLIMEQANKLYYTTKCIDMMETFYQTQIITTAGVYITCLENPVYYSNDYHVHFTYCPVESQHIDTDEIMRFVLTIMFFPTAYNDEDIVRVLEIVNATTIQKSNIIRLFTCLNRSKN